MRRTGIGRGLIHWFLMGKHKVSSMFSSASMFRKNKEDKSGQIKGFSTDSILEDVLAEITPDAADREK